MALLYKYGLFQYHHRVGLSLPGNHVPPHLLFLSFLSYLHYMGTIPSPSPALISVCLGYLLCLLFLLLPDIQFPLMSSHDQKNKTKTRLAFLSLLIRHCVDFSIDLNNKRKKKEKWMEGLTLSTRRLFFFIQSHTLLPIKS